MNYINSRIFTAQDFCPTEEDFLRLDNARPFGLSGHLRVRNEALTLRACLDSCLPFLDELIITYNDSIDDTEDILHEYARRFPNKIRLFWYPLEWGTCRGKMQARPLGHLAQFYNFGYSKVRYEFYMKIDGDQIYFTDKMLFIKEMLQKYSTNPSISHLFDKQGNDIYTFYERNIAKALSSKDHTLIFGGLNICYNDGEFYVYTLDNLDEKPLFNGFFGDAFIVRPSSKQVYSMQGEYFETFPLQNTKCVPLGLIWVHLGFIKLKLPVRQSNVIALKDAHTFSWDNVYKIINTKPTQDQKTHNTYKNLGRQFWDRDVPTFLTKEFYDKYFNEMIVRVRKYFM